MSFWLTCECGESYKLADKYLGRKVKCPDCGRKFRAQADAPEAPAKSPAFVDSGVDMPPPASQELIDSLQEKPGTNAEPAGSRQLELPNDPSPTGIEIDVGDSANETSANNKSIDTLALSSSGMQLEDSAGASGIELDPNASDDLDPGLAERAEQKRKELHEDEEDAVDLGQVSRPSDVLRGNQFKDEARKHKLTQPQAAPASRFSPAAVADRGGAAAESQDGTKANAENKEEFEGVKAKPITDTSIPEELRLNKYLLHRRLSEGDRIYIVYDEDKNPKLFLDQEAFKPNTVQAIFAGIGAGILVFVGGAVAIMQLALPDFFVFVPVLLGMVAHMAVVWNVRKGPQYRFYNDKDLQKIVFSIRQDRRTKFPHITYFISDPKGQLLGSIRKNGLKPEIHVLNKDGKEVFQCKIGSPAHAFFGLMFARTLGLATENAAFYNENERVVIGEYLRENMTGEFQVLDLEYDTTGVDRRIAISFCFLLGQQV